MWHAWNTCKHICKGRYTGFNRFQVFILFQPYIGCLVEMTSMTVLLGWVVLTMQKGDGHQSTFIGITLWKEGKHMEKLMFSLRISTQRCFTTFCGWKKMFFLKKTLQSTHEHRSLYAIFTRHEDDGKASGHSALSWNISGGCPAPGKCWGKCWIYCWLNGFNMVTIH